jgi:hypothetical protein
MEALFGAAIPIPSSKHQSQHMYSNQQPKQTRCVILATDSDKVVQQVQLYASQHTAHRMRIKVFTSKLDRTKYNHQTKIEDRTKLDRPTVMLEALADLALLSLADVHVGSFFSCFRRIAYQLAPVSSLPYASFDARWCPYAVCVVGWGDKRAMQRAVAEYWRGSFRLPAPPGYQQFYNLIKSGRLKGSGAEAVKVWMQKSEVLPALY